MKLCMISILAGGEFSHLKNMKNHPETARASFEKLAKACNSISYTLYLSAIERICCGVKPGATRAMKE